MPKTAQTPFEAFQAMTAKIVSVPKEVVDERDKQWKKERKQKTTK